VAFRRKSNNLTVAEISFMDRARTQVELDEQFRNFSDALSIDDIAVGHVDVKVGEPDEYPKPVFVTYEYGKVDTELSERLLLARAHNIELYVVPEFANNYIRASMAGFRTLTMFMSDIDAWGVRHGFSSLQEEMEYWQQILIMRRDTRSLEMRHTDIVNLKAYARAQVDYIKSRVLYLLSDPFYLITANPYFGTMLGYYSGMFETINLGEVLTDNAQVHQFLSNLTDIVGTKWGDSFLQMHLIGLVDEYIDACLKKGGQDPLVVLDTIRKMDFSPDQLTSLREIGIDPFTMPRTIQSLLCFLLPRGLRLEEVIG